MLPPHHHFWTSENIFAELVHTMLDGLGHRMDQGISLIHKAPVSFILAHFANIILSEARLKTKTLTHFEFTSGYPCSVDLKKLTRPH